MSCPRLLAVPLVVLLLALSGCGGSGDRTTKLTVFAASSLQEPFTVLAEQFEEDHPGTTVEFSFGASSSLAEQLHAAAPADVFASASTSTMDQVTKLVSGRRDFATNTMEIAVPPGNPAHITKLADLARSGVKLAVCQAEVPCGVVAAAVFANAKLDVKPVTEEVDVKSVLAKVDLGEVDAGIVYVSDVKTAGNKVRGVLIPADVNAVTTYPIGVLKSSNRQSLAKAFEALVVSSAGQQALAASGFAKP